MAVPLGPFPPPLELNGSRNFFNKTKISPKKVIFSSWQGLYPPPLLMALQLRKGLFCGFPIVAQENQLKLMPEISKSKTMILPFEGDFVLGPENNHLNCFTFQGRLEFMVSNNFLPEKIFFVLYRYDINDFDIHVDLKLFEGVSRGDEFFVVCYVIQHQCAAL